MADASVDLIVTSPPYWGLRSYRDGGEHYQGQIGSEATPQAFVDELVGMIDGEWRRVLKPSGSMFLNLGDKYVGSRGGNQSGILAHRNPALEQTRQENAARFLGAAYPQTTEARPKSLLGLPWRVALALIDRGWILRAEIIWSKPNGLPESVTDRVRRSHEQVFHFTLEPRYYSAVDEIREPHAYPAQPTDLSKLGPARSIPGQREHGGAVGRAGVRHGNIPGALHSLGRLPGSVWTIPTSPLIVPDAHREHWNLPDHFAAYPPELVRRIMLGWSPERVCSVCGEGRRPVVKVEQQEIGHTHRKKGGPMRDSTPRDAEGNERGWNGSGYPVTRSSATVVGEACACPTPDADTTPGIVLDPMCGTGTSVGVAHKLGRHAIGVDLSHDYCRLARWRVEASGHFDSVESKTWEGRQEGLW